LAKEIPAELLPLHPGGNLSQRERQAGLTFIELMEENLLNIKRGLGCD
jgi:ABC-type Zn uptake system ZnuABC Zn-binding protein ZnuA